MTGKPGILGGDGAGGGHAADRDGDAGSGARQFVQSFLARDDQRSLGAQLLQRFGIDRSIVGAGDADQLAADMRGIGERAHQVEDRPPPDLLPNGRDPRHGGMVVGGEEKGDADIGQARLRHFARALHVEAENLQRVGGPRLGGSGTIAMLGDRYAQAGDDQ